MKVFGKNFELNRLIKAVATHLGPEIASVVGVLVPCVGWTFIFSYFNLPWALALMVGFNLKRFEQQLTSIAFEREARKIQKMINDKIGESVATLPTVDSTTQDSPTSIEEGK
jgi:hypothetical protein